MFKDRLNKALDIVKLRMIAQERQQSIGHIEDKTSPMDVVTDIDRETQDLILKPLRKISQKISPGVRKVVIP